VEGGNEFVFINKLVMMNAIFLKKKADCVTRRFNSHIFGWWNWYTRDNLARSVLPGNDSHC
jgi:hypothetical protein